VNTKSAEGLNGWIRTVSGVLRHPNPHLAGPYFNENGFR